METQGGFKTGGFDTKWHPKQPWGISKNNQSKPFKKEALLYNSVEISHAILAHQLFFLKPLNIVEALSFSESGSIPRIDAVEEPYSNSLTHWIPLVVPYHSYGIRHTPIPSMYVIFAYVP